ncbi:MAG: NUDIX hydrolase [Sneathiella sp.]|nr:NUDIX hydrolase [Sneathiella sp.]
MIDSGADLFRTAKPATPPRHLISYFVLIDGDYVLLVDHINAQLWLPTGGHVDPNENPRETVKRVIFEEFGIKARFLYSSPIFLTVTETVGLTAGHTDVSLWYALQGDRTEQLDFDRSEFRENQWFHRNHVPFERSDPHMERFLSKLDLQ